MKNTKIYEKARCLLVALVRARTMAEDEDDEHQFFFSFPEGAFSTPAGDGNIDNASDAINYLDKDENGNNVGLYTSWTTSTDAKTGRFKVVLMHQSLSLIHI